MNIAIVGSGYVGLVSGACFAEMGVDVTCVDIDKQKIDNLIAGIIPIYEPGLDELVARNSAAGRLHFTTSLESVIDDVEIVFSAVGTPPDEDGSADLQYVLEVARTFGRCIKKYALLVTKSTVPVGTSKKIKQVINEELAKRGENIPFEVASNPEFLKEGAAIKDFMSPDRVVIGIESDRAKKVMERLYRPFLLNNFRVIFMDIASAEMTKYAANSMLATRISFMNDIANLCELVGADVNMVRKGIGSDVRIGNKFLYAIIEAVEAVNQYQKEIVYKKLNDTFNNNIKGKRIAIWGLSFKPETDDMREAPSLIVIDKLVKSGADVIVYDPVAMNECRRRIGDKVEYAKDMYDAVIDADALALLTEWKEFRLPSWSVIHKAMKGNIVVDGRNIYDPDELSEAGFQYHCIGL